MLIHDHDAADEATWRRIVADHDFGQLITATPGADGLPAIVPTHFRFDGVDSVELHLHRRNPALEVLRADARAVLSVIAAYVYVPTSWNAGDRPPEHGVPTSYYAAVQLSGAVSFVEEPVAFAEQLARQVDHFQPEGGHAPVTADAPYGPMLGAIVGLRLRVESVRAKAKFGGNKSVAHRLEIADRLAARHGPHDAEARRFLLDGVDRDR